MAYGIESKKFIERCKDLMRPELLNLRTVPCLLLTYSSVFWRTWMAMQAVFELDVAQRSKEVKLSVQRCAKVFRFTLWYPNSPRFQTASTSPASTRDLITVSYIIVFRKNALCALFIQCMKFLELTKDEKGVEMYSEYGGVIVVMADILEPTPTFLSSSSPIPFVYTLEGAVESQLL